MRVVTKDAFDKEVPIERYVTFFNAFQFGEEYNSEFTIKMRLANPKDNLPREKYDALSKAFHIRSITFDLNELSQSTNPVLGRVKSATQNLQRTARLNTPGVYQANEIKKWADEINNIGTTPTRRELLHSEVYKRIDKYDDNDKQYKLKCDYPCADCKEDSPEYCLACWGKHGYEDHMNVAYFLQGGQ
jgi:hypothetical protein